MTRTESLVDIDFLIVFQALVITASTATVVCTADEPSSNWPLAVVWLGLVGAVVQFVVNGAWWRPATLALVASAAVLALRLRGADDA